MLYLGYVIHAWLMFIAPLISLGYRPSFKKQAIFTVLYALGIILFRGLYEILPLPFGTHTILLIILNIILFKILMKDIDWIKASVISLIAFILMFINDVLILVPFMKYLNISINYIETNKLLSLFVSAILTNFLLLASCLTYGILNTRKK